MTVRELMETVRKGLDSEDICLDDSVQTCFSNSNWPEIVREPTSIEVHKVRLMGGERRILQIRSAS